MKSFTLKNTFCIDKNYLYSNYKLCVSEISYVYYDRVPIVMTITNMLLLVQYEFQIGNKYRKKSDKYIVHVCVQKNFRRARYFLLNS